MYDRISVAVVTGVVVMLIAAFFIVVGVLQPNAGTAPPVLEQLPVAGEEVQHASED